MFIHISIKSIKLIHNVLLKELKKTKDEDYIKQLKKLEREIRLIIEETEDEFTEDEK